MMFKYIKTLANNGFSIKNLQLFQNAYTSISAIATIADYNHSLYQG